MKLASHDELWLSQSMSSLNLENLLLSAKLKGATGLYLRVQCSRDGTPYIFPCETIRSGKQLGEEGLFRYHSDEQLNSFVYKNQRPFTLAEGLLLLSNWKKQSSHVTRFILNFECCHIEDLPRVIVLLRKMIASGQWPANELRLSSANQPLLLRAHQEAPNLGLAVKLQGVPVGYADFVDELNVWEVHVDAEFLSAHLVRDVAARSVMVRVIYKSHLAGSQAVFDMGARGIIASDKLVQVCAKSERCA